MLFFLGFGPNLQRYGSDIGRAVHGVVSSASKREESGSLWNPQSQEKQQYVTANERYDPDLDLVSVDDSTEGGKEPVRGLRRNAGRLR